MKNLLLFIPILVLGLVSCDNNDNKKPEPPKPAKVVKEDLTPISNTFKAIGVIHGNLGKGSEKTPAQLVELYNKEIKKQVADAYQEQFAMWIAHMKDNGDQEAEKGKAGFLGGKRYLDANGIELSQIVKKGFIGAFQLNGFNAAMMQGVSSKSKEERKAALDKAVTYLWGNVDSFKKGKNAEGKYDVYPGNEFAKYMNEVSESKKYNNVGDMIYKQIENAYSKVDNSKEFNTAITMVNKYVTAVVAFRGVHYLAQGEKLQNGFDAGVAHAVSEGLGFCFSLQFAFNIERYGYYLKADQAKEFVKMNLWAADAPEMLEKKAKEISGMFGFTIAEAK